MNKLQIFAKGFLKENPVFVLLLGMCPTLGVTTSAINGLGMGLATTFVLIMSNMVVSLVKDFIPDKVRIPSYIVIIASFVTIVELTMQAYAPSLFEALGIFIPLIVVNCIILGRAEAFASKNRAIDSILDGAGIGLGFAMALTILGAIREILGSGKFFGIDVYSGDGALIFVLAPGAFLVLGYLIALSNKLNKKLYKK
jgi:electron transport complex protein RnfE